MTGLGLQAALGAQAAKEHFEEKRIALRERGEKTVERELNREEPELVETEDQHHPRSPEEDREAAREAGHRIGSVSER